MLCQNFGFNLGTAAETHPINIVAGKKTTGLTSRSKEPPVFCSDIVANNQ